MERKQFIVKKIESVETWRRNEYKRVTYYVSDFNPKETSSNPRISLRDLQRIGTEWSDKIYEAKIFDEVPEYLSKRYRNGILSLDSDEVLDIILNREKELKRYTLELEKEKTKSKNQLTGLGKLKEKVREARKNLAEEISDKLVNF